MSYEQTQTTALTRAERDEERKGTPLTRVLDELEETVGGLESQVTQIEHRLEPLTLNERPVIDNREATLNPSASQLVARLGRAVGSINMLRTRLADLNNTLEI
jgi:uncharacterized protein YoxC